MGTSRDEIVNNPNDPSLLDLVPDVLRKGIPSQVSAPDAAQLMANLAKTGTTLYKQYQPALDKIAAKQLLTYVFQANAVGARKMYVANPRLLFIIVTAEEWASGFEKETDDPIHRSVQLSPLRAFHQRRILRHERCPNETFCISSELFNHSSNDATLATKCCFTRFINKHN